MIEAEDNKPRLACLNGFCMVCGEPNFKPVKYKGLISCHECFMTRTDDMIQLAKTLKISLESETK